MSSKKIYNLIQINQLGDTELDKSVRHHSESLKMKDDIDYFANPKKIMSRKELETSPPPRSAGVYGWYFHSSPPYVKDTDCISFKTGLIFKDKWKLLYIGKASNLRVRIIDEHFDGKPVRKLSQSTLRQSLGCLLADKLGICFWKYPDEIKQDYTFGTDGEKKLSKWMAEYAKVTWVESLDCEELEKMAINKYSLPLNITGNSNHPFYKPLTALRKYFKRSAPPVDSDKYTDYPFYPPLEAIKVIHKVLSKGNR